MLVKTFPLFGIPDGKTTSKQDDADVELLTLGWELQWEYWLAGKEPPAWALIAFGQVCVTARLLASAKKMEKEPVKETPLTVVGNKDDKKES